jgi:hypothetical protein
MRKIVERERKPHNNFLGPAEAPLFSFNFAAIIT